MTRQQAMALARKKWGKEAWVRENSHFLDADTKAILRAELEKLKQQEPKPPPPTPEQKAYRKAWQKWKDEMSNLRGKILAGNDRWSVGDYFTLPGIGRGTATQGSGDTLEEACRKAGLIK